MDGNPKNVTVKEYNDRYTYGGLLILPLTPPPSELSIWDNKSMKWIDYKNEEDFEKEVNRRLIEPIAIKKEEQDLKDFMAE